MPVDFELDFSLGASIDSVAVLKGCSAAFVSSFFKQFLCLGRVAGSSLPITISNDSKKKLKFRLVLNGKRT